MRSLSRRALVGSVSLAFLLMPALAAAAAETAGSELVIIPAGETVQGDLYAVGVEVVIEGVVDGDLVAFAAEEVSISGEVTGSVTAVAPTVTVDGTVGGSVRASGTRLEVTGAVGRDLVAAVLEARLDAGSRVGGDVLVWALNLESAGSIAGDLGGTQRSLRIEGDVGGDVDVTTGHLTVSGPLQVAGDLGYRSSSEADGLDQVTVGGVVVHESPLPPNIRIRALNLLARILTILILSTAAMLVAWGWPAGTRRAGREARSHPVKAWARGAPIVFAPLLLAGIAGLAVGLAPTSATLALLVIFIPLVVVTLGIVLLLSLVAGVPTVLALGQALPGRLELYGSILLGSLVAGLVWLIPWVGWLVPVLVLPIGLGAFMTSFRAEPEPAQPI
jgi:cytoskeletal protein CcmA (bactofilin family)